jgi:hypothetical protein
LITYFPATFLIQVQKSINGNKTLIDNKLIGKACPTPFFFRFTRRRAGGEGVNFRSNEKGITTLGIWLFEQDLVVVILPSSTDRELIVVCYNLKTVRMHSV